MTAHQKPAKVTKGRGTRATRAAPAPLVSPLRSRIIAQARLAADKAVGAKSIAIEAIEAAHECGKLLLLEKTWILEVRDQAREKLKLLKENGQSATPEETFWKDADWSTWYDAQYAGAFPLESADRYMRLAKGHENQTAFDFHDSPNVVRSGLLALRFYPSKIHATIAGDVALPKPASHLAVVNRFALWLASWKKRHRVKPSDDERQRLLADFAVVAQFIDELRAGESKSG